ncbi:MAG: hypothetical protein IJX63_14125 [Lachnospiraceae bacterium]|nr:hypothetical protein [Lachnospiraceae bacterium]
MKALYRKFALIGVVFSMLLVSCCGCSRPRRMQLEVELRFNGNEYWERYDMSDTMYPTQEALQKQVETYIVQIEDMLQVYNWWEYLNSEAERLIINMTIEEGGKSEARYLSLAFQDEVKTNIKLSEEWVVNAKLDGKLAHELTHIILGSSFSLSLEEGMCQYVQGRLGPENFEEDYGWTWQENFKLYVTTSLEKGIPRKQLDEVISNVGEKGREYIYLQKGELGNTMENYFWYQYSRAFVEYLVEQYGMERVVKLLQNGESENDYEKYLGKSFYSLKEEWMEHFENLIPPMTVEEVAEAEKESYEKWEKSLKAVNIKQYN